MSIYAYMSYIFFCVTYRLGEYIKLGNFYQFYRDLRLWNWTNINNCIFIIIIILFLFLFLNNFNSYKWFIWKNYQKYDYSPKL